jgi:hypothetical protein
VVTAGAAAQTPPGQTAKAFENNSASSQSITGRQRLNWAVKSTIGPVSLTAGRFSASFGTAMNRPREYGPHWDGGVDWRSVGRRPEIRATGQSVKGRIRNVIVMTFAARRANGDLAPAYARYVGISGNNFLSNTWRADSESGVGDACLRTALGFAGRMDGNAFAEFWPTLTKHLFHKKR